MLQNKSILNTYDTSFLLPNCAFSIMHELRQSNSAAQGITKCGGAKKYGA